METQGYQEQGSALAELRDRLAELQLAQIAHRRRAIILFEGLEGSGKKYALRQLAAAFDPCHFAVHPTGPERREASEGHWLARFWRSLPSAGNSAIFYRSWYRRVLDDRVLGLVDADAIPRSFDEINEFEAQQRDYGTLIVKLFFEVRPEVQVQRLAQRATAAWPPLSHRDEPIPVSHPGYLDAVSALRANSDTRWSPWVTIDGNDEGQGAIAALGAIADVWAGAIPGEPSQMQRPPLRA